MGLGVQFDKAVLHAKADIAGDFVFETDACRPSVAPIVERKTIQRSRVTTGKLDFSTSPSGFAIEQPLIRGDAEAACHGRDRIDIGAEALRWNENAVEVLAQVGAAHSGFHTQHDVAELLIVANLATAYEPARIVVEAFTGQADIGPLNVTPGAANVAADVEAGPTRDWRNRITSTRAINVGEPGTEGLIAREQC